MTGADTLRRVGVAAVVAACIVGLWIAITGTREVDPSGEAVVERGNPCEVVISGDEVDAPACDPDREEAADIVEQVFPARDSEALQQVQVGIDLGNRYTGVLVVNGIEVPEAQLVRQEALNQVFFSPGEGQVIESWAPGRNCVEAIVWPITEGRSASRPVPEWCFEVT